MLMSMSECVYVDAGSYRADPAPVFIYLFYYGQCLFTEVISLWLIQ